MASGNTTIDHDFIRRWVEERDGTPSRVKGTEGRDGEGILRIDFAEPDDKLEPISWEEFFDTFEDRELAFLYQEKTEGGQTSRFFKFIHRSGSGDEASGPGGKPAHRSTVSRSAAGDRPAAAAKSAPEGKKMAQETHQRGQIKDQENDGRRKENREAGRTKGTTPGSEARAHEHGRETQANREGHGGSKSAGHSSGGSHSSGGRSSSGGSQSQSRGASSDGGSDDLKSREYKDEKGEVHHHTRTYMEQHKDK